MQSGWIVCVGLLCIYPADTEHLNRFLIQQKAQLQQKPVCLLLSPPLLQALLYCARI